MAQNHPLHPEAESWSPCPPPLQEQELLRTRCHESGTQCVPAVRGAVMPSSIPKGGMGGRGLQTPISNRYLGESPRFRLHRRVK